MTLSTVPLSVLDTSPIVQGSTARQALRNTVDLAQLTDQLGYHRYWVPEHHSMRGVASAAPAVLAGQIAAATGRIRVGSGGVLLANHSPLVVAEQFGTLEAFHPGRIDLGIGRALGGSKATAAAVRSEGERTASSFADQLRELVGYLDPPADASVRAIPAAGNAPPVWLLGSTDFSAQLAGELGLPYAFAYHLQPAGITSALRLYRESFTPSKARQGPYLLVSVPVLVAPTDGEAQWLAGPNRLKVLSRKLGKSILLPSPWTAAEYAYTPEHHQTMEQLCGSNFVGSPDTVGKGIADFVDEHQPDELMVQTKVYDHADLRRSFELLAHAAA